MHERIAGARIEICPWPPLWVRGITMQMQPLHEDAYATIHKTCYITCQVTHYETDSR
jgi:hypothetical protein